jgi:serine/threonine-protein kinase RsbT
MEETKTYDQVELAKLSIARIQDVLLARMIGREEGVRMGFTPKSLTQIATAVSEITRNVVQHAGSPGHVRVFEITDGARRGLKIVVEDSGVGIADLDRVVAGASPGAGIPGCRRLMDEFAIRSSAGAGAAVTMVKWVSSGC